MHKNAFLYQHFLLRSLNTSGLNFDTFKVITTLTQNEQERYFAMSRARIRRALGVVANLLTLYESIQNKDARTYCNTRQQLGNEIFSWASTIKVKRITVAAEDTTQRGLIALYSADYRGAVVLALRLGVDIPAELIEVEVDSQVRWAALLHKILDGKYGIN